MKEHEDREFPGDEKPSVIVDSTLVEEIVTGRLGGGEGKNDAFLAERDEGEDMMVDVVGADAVRSVEECMQKETEIRDLNMNMKEEVAGSGEDVCHASVGTSVLTSEKVEVTVNEEGLKTSINVRDCEMAFESRGEPQVGGGDVSVIDGKEQMERGSTMEQHVESVEECMQKEIKSQNMDMDMEEAAASGEDVCHDSVGSGVLAFEKVEVTVVEEGSKRSGEVSGEILQGNVVTACGSLLRDCKESSVGGGDIAVIDSKGLNERGSTEEVVEQHVESVEEVADGNREMDIKTKKEAEILDIAVTDSKDLTERGSTEEVVEQYVESVEEVADGDREMDIETKKEAEILDIAVIDSKDLTERGSTEEVVEQHVESVEEVADGDRVMDKKIKQEAEILDSSKIAESSTTTANLCSQEVDMIVVEDGFGSKDEAEACVSVDPSLVSANNQNSSTELVSVGTDEVAGRIKEESLHTTIEVITDDSQGNASREPCFVGGENDLIDSEEVSDRGLPNMEQPMECDQQVADKDCMVNEKTGKESEALDSSKVSEPLITTNHCSEDIDIVVAEEGLASKEEAQDGVSVDPSLVCANNQNSSTGLANVETDEIARRCKEETLHPTIGVITDGSQGNASREPRFVGGENDLIDKEEESERGLPKEIMEHPMECDQQVADGDCVVDEIFGKESEALDSSKILEPSTMTNPGSEDVDVVVVEEGLASKDEVQDGVSVDPSLVCADNRSLSTMVVNSATNEGDVIAQAGNLDQQAEVDKWSKKQSFHPTTEVIASDAQNPENGTGVGDSKSAVDSSSGEPQFGGETAVIAIKETEKGLTEDEIVEQHPESVQVVTYGDDLMDEKTGKGDGVLDSSKIPESLTTANLGLQEVLTTKIEAQDSDSVGQRLVCPDNRNLSTENSDQRAEVDTMSKDESMTPTIEVAACTEADEVTRSGSVSSSGIEKQKAFDSISDGSEKMPSIHPDKVPTALVSTPKPSLKVGECIQRVATQLTGPPLVLKSNSDPNVQQVDQLVESAVSSQTPENSQGERMIVESKQSAVAEMLSQLHLVAQDPMKGYSFLNTIKPFFHDRRTAVGRPFSVRKRKTSNENEPEEFEFDDVNDSYWTDRIVQNNPEEQLLQDNQNGGQEHHVVAYEPDKPAKPNRRSNKKRYMFSNHEMGLKEQSELVERRRQNLATEVVLKFPEGIYIPSEIHLNKMFRRFGALMESETEVDRQNGRARVVFKKCCDAEVAHSSAGKFNIFGSISVNYELNYTPLVSYKPLLLSILEDPMDAS